MQIRVRPLIVLTAVTILLLNSLSAIIGWQASSLSRIKTISVDSARTITMGNGVNDQKIMCWVEKISEAKTVTNTKPDDRRQVLPAGRPQ